VRSVTADDLQSAIDRLSAAQGELAAVAERMRYVKLRQITLTGWGKFERAMDLLQEFSAHAEFAVNTSKTRD